MTPSRSACSSDERDGSTLAGDAVALRPGRRCGGREAVVPRHRLLVELPVQLRRVAEDLLRNGDPHLLLAFVHMRELARQGVLRLPKRPVLDDQEVALLADDRPHLLVLGRNHVVTVHVPLLRLLVSGQYPGCREAKRGAGIGRLRCSFAVARVAE